MAWRAGREAAEEAAAPYRWETRVRSLLRWRRRVGLWRSGQECQAPLAASTRLAVSHNAHGRVVGVGLGDGGEAVKQGQRVLGAWGGASLEECLIV